jgi:hypothetical protein
VPDPDFPAVGQMRTHNIDQVMAWQPADVGELAGRWIAVVIPADEQAFLADKFTYAGDWDLLGYGTVQNASMDDQRTAVQVTFTSGDFLRWAFDQPFNVIEGVQL